jgi:hypothetical protein
MRYRELVSIQQATLSKSATAATSRAWATIEGLADLPATIVPSVIGTRGPEMVTIADQYDVVIAGKHEDIKPEMAVLDSADRRYIIDEVDVLLGGRQTRLTARHLSA